MPKAYLEGIGNQQLKAEDMDVVRHVKDEPTCACEKSQKYCNTHLPLPLVLLRRHLFPLTPCTPGNAIHLELMRAIHHLHYLCCLSIHGIATFCGAFNRRKIPVSFKNRLSEALPMYDRMMLNVEKQYRIDCGLIKACPGCKFVNGRKGISADGNFQWRRLKRAKDTPNVVYKESEVDNYWVDTIVEYGSTGKENEVKGCTSFTALEKKGGSLNGLDETGVFGITCDHGFPLAFVDMTTPGEQYKYVLSALNEVILNPLYGGNICIMHDVGCKIQKAITATPYLQTLKDPPISVGIFHITGHVPEYQIKSHPRHLQGFGLRDGEWMERLWSYLNDFVSMARYMSPLNRRLTLTVALDTFAQQKSACILDTASSMDTAVLQSKENVREIGMVDSAVTGLYNTRKPSAKLTRTQPKNKFERSANYSVVTKLSWRQEVSKLNP
ncbi:hypothetical protein BJV82DRAFT_667301 [Fennellomyces sp. T-0311]|nr:hypothetical protein BJV82DRAFT_667301 [Fennellomyces sp. T-0311]